MIALSLVSLLFVAFCAGQWVLAPWSADRRAVRRLRARGLTVEAHVGAELVRTTARRLRRASAGGAVATMLATLGLWLQWPEPNGVPGLARVAVVLTAVVLGYTAGIVLDVVRSTSAPSGGPRVAGLTARDPHASPRERLAETTLLAVAAAALVVTALALASGVDAAGTALGCAVSSVVIIAVSHVARRRVLLQPVSAADTDHAVAAEVLTAVTVDDLSDNLVANGALLLLYAFIVVVPGLAALGTGAMVVLLVAGTWAATTAATERRRDRRPLPSGRPA